MTIPRWKTLEAHNSEKSALVGCLSDQTSRSRGNRRCNRLDTASYPGSATPLCWHTTGLRGLSSALATGGASWWSDSPWSLAAVSCSTTALTDHWTQWAHRLWRGGPECVGKWRQTVGLTSYDRQHLCSVLSRFLLGVKRDFEIWAFRADSFEGRNGILGRGDNVLAWKFLLKKEAEIFVQLFEDEILRTDWRTKYWEQNFKDTSHNSPICYEC